MFDISELAQIALNMQLTKRNLMSLVGRFYELLRFLAPITIKFKVLFQKVHVCQDKTEWDSLLSDDSLQEWMMLVTDLKEGELIFVPRKYFHCLESDSVSLTLCAWFL